MSRKHRFSRHILHATVAASSLGAGLVAMPPVAAAESMVLEEVVITARRREESLQDVPVAVTAFTGDQLRAAGIQNLKDLGLHTPGLQVDQSSTAQIWIRGIGQRDDSSRVDGPVGVYLDGIYLPRKESQLLDIIDVQSVQVLRGPQGTLFGKNTTGGALLVTTAEPTNEFGGYVEGRLGNFDRMDAKAVVNVPLVADTLLSKLTLASIERDGYQENIVTGQEAASEDRQTIALQLDWMPTDSLKVKTFASYGETREVQPATNCTWMTNSSFNGEDALFANRMWPGDTVGVDINDDNDTPVAPGLVETSPTYEALCRESEELLDERKFAFEVPNMAFNLDNLLLGVNAEWEVTENLALASITGYGDQKRFGNGGNPDNDATRIPISARYRLNESDREQISQEFHIKGSMFDERLDYTFGLFGMVEDIDDGTDTSSNIVSGTYFGAPSPSFLLINAPSAEDNTYWLENTTYAAFFQGSFAITENLELTAGLRWTSEQREQEVLLELLDEQQFASTVGGVLAGMPGILAFIPDPGLAIINPAVAFQQDIFTQINAAFSPRPETGLPYYPLLPGVRQEVTETWDEVTPMVSLSYQLPDSLLGDGAIDSAMVYASYAEGFKSGTFEPLGLDGLTAVDPELVDNIELGFKMDMLDASVRLNGAVFRTDFDGMQLRQVRLDSTQTPRVVLDNASKARIEGVELELSWAPMAGLLLIANGSFNDYEYLDFTEEQFSSVRLFGQQPLETVDRSDEPFAEVPELTWALGAQYTIQDQWGQLVTRLDYSWIDDIFMGLDAGAGQNEDQSTFDAYGLLSARVAWLSPGEQYEVALYGTNLLDEEHFFGAAAVGDSVGTFPVTLGPPRMYGVEVRYHF